MRGGTAARGANATRARVPIAALFEHERTRSWQRGTYALRGASKSAKRPFIGASLADYEATPFELQTGMPSLRALSAGLAEMP